MVGAHPRRPPNQRRHHAHARRITDPQRALDFRGHGCRTRWVALAGNRLGDIEAGDTLDIKCEQVHVVGIGEWMVRAEGEPRSRPKPPIPVPSGVAHDEAAAGREKIEIRLLALGQSFDRVVEETVAPVDGRPAVTLVVCAPRPHFAVELVEFPPHARGVHRTIENGPQKVESRIGDAAGPLELLRRESEHSELQLVSACVDAVYESADTVPIHLHVAQVGTPPLTRHTSD
jgi:hypothetical protein